MSSRINAATSRIRDNIVKTSSNEMPKFGLAVKRARLAMGWSQADLAERFGVCRETISRIETGFCKLKHYRKHREPIRIWAEMNQPVNLIVKESDSGEIVK